MIEIEKERVGLIRQLENGRIVQIGLTESQSIMLQLFLSQLSKDKPLLQLGEDWDLILASTQNSNPQ